MKEVKNRQVSPHQRMEAQSPLLLCLHLAWSGTLAYNPDWGRCEIWKQKWSPHDHSRAKASPAGVINTPLDTTKCTSLTAKCFVCRPGLVDIETKLTSNICREVLQWHVTSNSTAENVNNVYATTRKQDKSYLQLHQEIIMGHVFRQA